MKKKDVEAKLVEKANSSRGFFARLKLFLKTVKIEARGCSEAQSSQSFYLYSDRTMRLGGGIG